MQEGRMETYRKKKGGGETHRPRKAHKLALASRMPREGRRQKTGLLEDGTRRHVGRVGCPMLARDRAGQDALRIESKDAMGQCVAG